MSTIANVIIDLSPNTKQAVVSAQMYARSSTTSEVGTWSQYWFNDGSSVIHDGLNDTVALAV